MNKKFVRVLADIKCEWEGLDPIYRVYVNEELFAERTWIWGDSYLEEMLQIEAMPGEIPGAGPDSVGAPASAPTSGAGAPAGGLGL